MIDIIITFIRFALRNNYFSCFECFSFRGWLLSFVDICYSWVLIINHRCSCIELLTKSVFKFYSKLFIVLINECIRTDYLFLRTVSSLELTHFCAIFNSLLFDPVQGSSYFGKSHWTTFSTERGNTNNFFNPVIVPCQGSYKILYALKPL